ncbi:MAG: ATP-binding protein, partial [Propionibacteriaceae bacterium]|nr:ATP-binding protein [Propionibacteriaceae bacterium]
MRRKITTVLDAWRLKPLGVRRPLLLQGARQVGKTYSLRELGANFKSVAHVNLEAQPAARSIFDGELDPKRIVHLLAAETRTDIIAGESLIVLDEIQASERAITSLKYFNEQAPEYHVAGAGSLLGIAINRSDYSFPVGNVESHKLFPLDFEEYLWALGDERLANIIREHFQEGAGIAAGMHAKALERYRGYLLTGGMPRAVKEFVSGTGPLGVREVQLQTLSDYLADMVKYATAAESVLIRAAFESIPSQLAKENHKFQYKLARKGGTASTFGPAIDWLRNSGSVLVCEKANNGILPLAAHSDTSSFKLYLADVGLLGALSDLPADVLLNAKTEHSFLGAVTENYVATALAANGFPLRYWASEGKAELDFTVQLGETIAGVEVKAGTHIRSKSLGVFTTKYP